MPVVTLSAGMDVTCPVEGEGEVLVAGLGGQGTRRPPPVTDTSDMVNVAGSIGSPKSTATVTDAALVGEAGQSTVGDGLVLSRSGGCWRRRVVRGP